MVNWHFARDDPMFTTIKVISRHEGSQLYGAILPDELTNEAIKDSESYKEYYPIALGAEPPKTKASIKKKKAGSDKIKTPTTAKGKRLKTSAKAAKPAKKKQPKSNDEEIDDEVDMSDDNDENDDDDDDADNQDDDGQDDDGQDDEGQNVDNEQTDSDNDGDDFVHPKFSTHDQEERQDKEDNEEEGGNVEREELNEETDEEEEVNELYRDVNVNLEKRDTEMTDAQQTNVQGTHVTEDTHVIMTAAAPEFEDRVKALEDEFSEFKQTNQFVVAVSLIPSIVDMYLANKMNEAIKTAIQLPPDRLRDEAQ
ncbi:hypothetical protein Tco_1413662, partial [Tanacetum coccineum]